MYFENLTYISNLSAMSFTFIFFKNVFISLNVRKLSLPILHQPFAEEEFLGINFREKYFHINRVFQKNFPFKIFFFYFFAFLTSRNKNRCVLHFFAKNNHQSQHFFFSEFIPLITHTERGTKARAKFLSQKQSCFNIYN